MPSKTVIFDHRVNVVHDFGVSMRNSVMYNPQGRLLLIAGFGNLSGKVDIWDRKTLKKVTNEMDASNTSHCEWSPDGRFLMCATLSPRLRVDNGVRIFHWSGALMHWDQYEELYQVCAPPFILVTIILDAKLTPCLFSPGSGFLATCSRISLCVPRVTLASSCALF